MHYTEIQLTTDPKGHTVNNIQVFSPDDQWIVYDTRNDDGGISKTGSIEMVNVQSREIKVLYRTQNQTEFGPGVGAATFSPVSNSVLFLQGIRNADKNNPYHFTRRTGVAVDLDQPLQPIYLDARDIVPPFTPGALRGGTHAHSWSGDGKWISCTYNDYVLEQLSKKDSSVKDLRTIAVMAPLKKIIVPSNGLENNNGELFSAIVAKVNPIPTPGTDEIDKAFDETWIGRNGYQHGQQWQKRAIAFQGNLRDENNKTKTEIFVVDIPDDITKASPGELLQGTERIMPSIPAGTVQRRITFTENGVEGPRHWLRSSADGKLIAFLAKDKNGYIQIFTVSPNGGNIEQITFDKFSVQASFNFSPDDKTIAYIADNSIFVTELTGKKSTRLTKRFEKEEAPLGGVIWSNSGNALVYNRYINIKEGKHLQIFLLKK